MQATIVQPKTYLIMKARVYLSLGALLLFLAPLSCSDKAESPAPETPPEEQPVQPSEEYKEMYHSMEDNIKDEEPSLYYTYFRMRNASDRRPLFLFPPVLPIGFLMISSLPQVVGLFCLVLLSAFFSSAEISLSAASKTRLMALSEDGDRRAAMVLEMREHPGQFFSALQIGLNATALLGGIVGDAAFSPFFQWLLAEILPGQDWGRISFVISFLIATTLFVIFADLLPKRLAIARPEAEIGRAHV